MSERRLRGSSSSSSSSAIPLGAAHPAHRSLSSQSRPPHHHYLPVSSYGESRSLPAASVVLNVRGFDVAPARASHRGASLVAAGAHPATPVVVVIVVVNNTDTHSSTAGSQRHPRDCWGPSAAARAADGGGPARRPPERAALHPDGRQGRARGPAVAHGPQSHRGRVVRAPRLGAAGAPSSSRAPISHRLVLTRGRQMRDGSEVMQMIDRRDGVVYPVLVPNVRCAGPPPPPPRRALAPRERH